MGIYVLPLRVSGIAVLPQTQNTTKAKPEVGRVRALLDLYGTLLTPKQLLLARCHYQQEKSLSEIARQQQVSRQAIHDAMAQVRHQLEYYEEKLQLWAKRDAAHLVPAQTSVPPQLREKLEGLRARISRQRIIYSVDWIVNDLNDLLRLLDSPDENAPL